MCPLCGKMAQGEASHSFPCCCCCCIVSNGGGEHLPTPLHQLMFYCLAQMLQKVVCVCVLLLQFSRIDFSSWMWGLELVTLVDGCSNLQNIIFPGCERTPGGKVVLNVKFKCSPCKWNCSFLQNGSKI